MHLCIRCRNKLDEVPAEVLVKVRKEETISETETERTVRITYEDINIANSLKAQMETMKKLYKYVFYCAKLITITVGSDVETQQKKECEHFAE